MRQLWDALVVEPHLPITWFYNDAMHQANTITDGHIVENNFQTFPVSRFNEDPPEINIRFFATGHWLIGMGHDRATSVQSAIGDAIFQIREALPGSAVQQARLELELTADARFRLPPQPVLQSQRHPVPRSQEAEGARD